MSALIKPFSQVLTSVQTVWIKLIAHITRDTATLVFVTITILLVFESLLMSLLLALAVLHSF